MKYYLVSLSSIENTDWQLLYCDKKGFDISEELELVAKTIDKGAFVGKFDKTKYVSIEAEIKNDDGLYLLKDFNGQVSIWQIGSKVFDMNAVAIPHLYRVRKIGIIVDK